jgi:hypothetical protein
VEKEPDSPQSGDWFIERCLRVPRFAVAHQPAQPGASFPSGPRPRSPTGSIAQAGGRALQPGPWLCSWNR